jgi:propionyl-CoA synthetase
MLIENYDLSAFRTLCLAGERTDPATLTWAQDKLGVPVIDHWWQTETGWPICANCAGIELLPVKPGSATKPVAGWDVQVLDATGQPVKAGEIGSIVCRLPLPPGTLPTLWSADERYERTYLSVFPGFYNTADAGFVDEDGYVHVMTRTDDVINVAGHRLATGAMEEVLASHPDVAECAVICVADALKGQVPLGLVVLKAGVPVPRHDDIVSELVRLVRERIGPVAGFKTATVVKRLPKTRSGKILRSIMRRIADGEPYEMPATIEDPGVLQDIEEAVRAMRRVERTSQ